MTRVPSNSRLFIHGQKEAKLKLASQLMPFLTTGVFLFTGHGSPFHLGSARGVTVTMVTLNCLEMPHLACPSVRYSVSTGMCEFALYSEPQLNIILPSLNLMFS